MSMETRAGVTPAKNEAPKFEISTKVAEQFLQEKFSAYTKVYNAQNGTNVEDVKISLFTMKCSKKFCPMVIVLPMSVLKSKGNNARKGELDIFNSDVDEGSAKVKDAYWNVLKCYTYTKDDVKTFFSSDFRSSVGHMGLTAAHFLKENCKPKARGFGKKKQGKYVTCVINPLTVFHDMLTYEGKKNEAVPSNMNNFLCFVDRCELISKGNYQYTVSRELKKNSRKQDPSIDQLINDMNNQLKL